MDDSSKTHLSPVWSHLSDVIIERGEGCYLYDDQGTAYLDFTSGIGVTNTGHCHPKVVRAIQEQSAKLIHGQINVIFNQPLLELTEKLRTVVPESLDGFFYSNSGAEAIEGAIKLARQATGRRNVIVFQGSFHGRTNQAMALTTSKTVYRAGYQPLAAGVFVAPFPYAYRYGWDEQTAVDFCLNELELVLKSQTAPEETAAMLIEPVLGEGGYITAPPAFMKGLRQICDRDGILLIFDEVQSGFGRTGKFFALEHSGVVPDILVMAKGLASGMPMSAIAAPLEMMSRWTTGTHGGTYGGNPVAAAAANATIDVILEEKLPQNAEKRGQQLRDALEEMQIRWPFLGDVRGWGLMVGLEIGVPGRGPDRDLATRIQAQCLDDNLFLLTCGTHGNVIRWIPPLIVTESQINDALLTMEEGFEEIFED